MVYLLYKFRSGKNTKLFYYIANYSSLIIPNVFFRSRLQKVLKKTEKRKDYAYIKERVDYYNQLSEHVILPDSAPLLSTHKLQRPKVYFFDSYEYTRWFLPTYRWGYCPGDITHVPSYPSIVKSRPLHCDNTNSILLKLNKTRHFIFVDDTNQFNRKENKAVFRGKVSGKATRIDFMEKYFGSDICDCGDVSKNKDIPAKWKVEKMTIREHLDYKFIMALEGNDVASNLKWIMSSNSIAVMPKPTCETWFMEKRLIPDYHYIEVLPDFSNLKEKLDYYIRHTDEALQIISHANSYVSQFKNKKRERLIALLVLRKYFEKTQ